MDSSHAVVAAVVAFAIAALAPVGVIPILSRVGVLDVPSRRSLHDRPAIRGVGIASLLGFAAGCLYLIALEADPLIVIAALTGSVASVLGFLDDARGVSVRIRAAAQLVIALLATTALIVSTGASWLLLPVGIIGIAAYINVANFMDGVNGISGLHGVVVGASLAIAGAGTGREWLLAAGLIVAGSFAAFLPWNLIRRGTFLGDAGSYLLGAAVSVVSAAALFDGVPLAVVLGPVLIYLVDTASTLLQRRSRGAPLAESHRDHIYQRLALKRWGHVPTALVVTGFSMLAAACGFIALSGGLLASVVAFSGLVVLAVAYLLLPAWVLGPWRDLSDGDIEVRATDPARTFTARRWAVVGAAGFVGGAMVTELRSRGAVVVELSAPRLDFDPGESQTDAYLRIAESPEVEQFAHQLKNVDVIVNAAGVADAGARGDRSLFGANAFLPLWLARAADRAGVGRMIHISSAAVQGRIPVLDESTASAAFSPYSRSKARGEALLLESRFTKTEVVIVRATSVQGPDRPTTIRLRRMARSRLASVAAPGDRPTVVSSIDALTAFIVSVGSHRQSVPPIVLQPWEGMTTADVLSAAGGRRPLILPALLCRLVIGAGYVVAMVVPGLAGAVRRVELMWFGQAEDAAWARGIDFVVPSRVGAVLAGPSGDAL
ncbi:MAG: NAD-dependent epimerase/dehydratase family protein [Pseudolysinimonas sp.]